MGRGSSSPRQDAVIKKRPSEILQTGNSSGKSRSQQDKCLFSFSGSLIISTTKAGDFQSGDSVVIVPSHSDPSKVDVYIKSIDFGEYKGNNLQKILACIKKGYTYEGIVESLTSITAGLKITFSVQGHKR